MKYQSFTSPLATAHPRATRRLVRAEQRTPTLLHKFLAGLETTENSASVWNMIVELGEKIDMPHVDFICANTFETWQKTLFIRTSYDSTWLQAANRDPEVSRWSNFRAHAMDCLTPIAVGLEFLDDFYDLPPARVAVLQEAARRGMRAGFSIPLRQGVPARSAVITFMGNNPRREAERIIAEHGWTLNVAAMAAHQRYMTHFHAEFAQRNKITKKQTELLGLIGRGLLDKRIAAELGISFSAVRQRMENLMRRTGMSNRAELAALAMSMGMLPDPIYGPDARDYDVMVEIDTPKSELA